MSDERDGAASPPPPAAMLDLITGYWVSQMVHVAAKLGLADQLKNGARTVEELAQATKTDAATLYRVMRALAGVGVFRESGARRFEQTPLSETLCTGSVSMRGFALMMVEKYNVEAWSDLLESVRSGKTAFDRVYGKPIFEYLREHPEDEKVFGESMSSLSSAQNPAVAEAYDFSGIRTLVDVGGGHGSLLATILAGYPAMRGVLYDLPEVIARAAADQHVRAPAVAGRIELARGSFFDSVPAGADAYIMKYILHDWDDERSTRILDHCRRAMAPGGRVLVVDTVIPPGNDPFWGKLLDINMLAMTGGRERTQEEFRSLFAGAGLELRRVVPTACPLSVVEAGAA